MLESKSLEEASEGGFGERFLKVEGKGSLWEREEGGAVLCGLGERLLNLPPSLLPSTF